jgi:hypothetical protein
MYIVPFISMYNTLRDSGCQLSALPRPRRGHRQQQRSVKLASPVAAAYTWLYFAACLTGADSTKKQRRGGTAAGAVPDGPILWRRLGFG